MNVSHQDQRLKVLVLSAEPPYPPSHGGARLRLYHLLRQLSNHHHITLLTLLETPSEREHLQALEKFCEKVVALDTPSPAVPPSLRQRLQAPFYRLAYSRDFAATLHSQLSTLNPSLVHVDTARMAVYTPLLNGQRKLMSAVDSATLGYRNRLAQIPFGPARLRARYTLHTVRNFERKLYPEYDACTVVAERDAAEIHALCPRLPMHVIPNGIDCAAYSPMQYLPEEQNLLLFTGTMDYGPNVDGMIWFVREILPLIQAAVPSAHLEIVGRNPTNAVRALAAKPGVTVTGFVPAVQPHLTRATVFVCPLRQGSGMKNKLLEAMAAGKGIVTTAEGASGIGSQDGLSYIVADAPDSFAQAVVALLRDPTRRQSLGNNARAFVRANYSWERAGQLMHELYLKVAD